MEYRFPEQNLYANYEVVGTHFYQESFARVLKRKPQKDEYLNDDGYEAHLVPEPDNPHDPNAISVRIDGWLIGYLSREDAAVYAPAVHRIAASGYTIVTNCRVVTSMYQKWNGQSSNYELDAKFFISLPAPNRITPLNDEADWAQLALLPWGRAAQVKGEEDHLEHLFNFVPQEGTGLVIATLHAGVTRLKNGTEKEHVEVRLEGERAGQMSPTVSAQFLPSIRHVEDMGKTLAAWSKFEGSALAVNITVQGARATELSDDWLNELPSAPVLVPSAPTYAVPPAFKTDKASRSTEKSRRNPPSSQRRPSPETPQESHPYSVPQLVNVPDGAPPEHSKAQQNKNAGMGCCGCLAIVVFIILLLALVV